jgi:hypothetical protein
MAKAAPYFNWLKEAPSEEEEKEEEEKEKKDEEKEEAGRKEKKSDNNGLSERQNVEYNEKDLYDKIDAL